MTLYSNLKFVAKNLIFEKQEDLLGKIIKINTKLPLINKRINTQISQFCDYDMTLQREKRNLAIKRYGLLDINFELRNLQLKKCNKPFQIMRDEKILKVAEPESSEFREENIEMMTFMLGEDIKKMKEGKLYLKIFAEATGNFISKRKYQESQEITFNTKLKYPKNPAKVEFEITDACITNLSGIWFNKHFYW